MKLLGIVGSRRKSGNTSSLVQEALQAVEGEVETEVIFLGDYAIHGCTGCEGCRDDFQCVIEDDMRKLYPKVLKAEGLILGSPTYFYNLSADMKAFIDRLYSLEAFAEDDRSCWVAVPEALGGRYGVVVAVCEQEDEKFMGYTAEALSRSLTDLGYKVVHQVRAVGFFHEGRVRESTEVMNEARRAGQKLLKTIRLRKELEEKVSSEDFRRAFY